MGIVRFALRFPHTFYVVAALILFLGVTAAVEMPTDLFPEINIPIGIAFFAPLCARACARARGS